jgi:hypothetical protein
VPFGAGTRSPVPLLMHRYVSFSTAAPGGVDGVIF